MARRRTANRRPIDELRAGQHRLKVTTLALYAVALVVILVVGASEYRTHQALCSFRDDLEQRVVQTQDYLATHPAQTLFGVPRKTLLLNVANQERTLRSLDGLYC